MTSLNVLSIDPAQRCGWAWSDGIRRHSGTWDLGANRGMVLRQRILAAVEQWPSDVIAYENAGFGSPNPAVQAMHNELAGVIKCACDELGLKCWAFNIATWKRLALGRGKLPKGKAGKLEVIRLLKIHHGIEVSNFDEADATGLLLAAMLGPPPLTKKKERKRVAKVVEARQPTLFRVK